MLISVFSRATIIALQNPGNAYPEVLGDLDQIMDISFEVYEALLVVSVAERLFITRFRAYVLVMLPNEYPMD